MRDEVAHAAAEGQAGDAGGGDDAEGDGQPIGMSGVVDVAGCAARLDPNRPACRIDPHAFHRGQVDHEPVVDAAEAGSVVPAAADGHTKIVFASEVDRGDDVGDVRAAGDD